MTEANEFTPYHVGVAAEAVVASLFARCGYNVGVQYGANQPGFDLLVANGKAVLKVSVKGSKDSGWGLSQSLLTKGERDYGVAIEKWLRRQPPDVIFAFVQYQGVALMEMPRVYLATPEEVAQRLRESAGGRGDTTLWEQRTWSPRAVGAGTTDRIPEEWKLSEKRIGKLLHGQTH